MKRIIVLGGEGIGMIASSVIDRMGEGEVIGFLNDIVPVGTMLGKKRKIEVLGTYKDIDKFLAEDDIQFMVAYGGMQREEDTYNKVVDLPIPMDRYYTAIDPSAVIPMDYTEVGRGVLISPFVQVGPDCSIEDNCILLGNSFIGHNTTIGRFSHIASNAVVGSYVTVGKAVHIGLNATIREKVHIGDYALIGAGAVILNDVPSNSIVVGNPGRILKTKGE